jgi:hypothetical protein
MNKMSKESIELTDRDLAAVSGGQKRIHMPPTTIVIVTEPIVITAKAPK